MAKKAKKEEVVVGAPRWMSSFADLMSLLLCFFVLIYAMTEDTVSQENLAAFLAGFGNPNMQAIITVVQPGAAVGTQFASGLLSIPTPAINRGPGEAEITGMDVDIQAAIQTIVSDFETYFIESDNPLAQEIDIQVINDQIMLTFPSDMTFASGSSQLTPITLEILDYIATVISQWSMFNVNIYGHTDNIPINTIRYEDNHWLGFGRANSVFRHFADNHNIDVLRMYATSRGEYVPIADNNTTEGRALNRRVEIVIHPSNNG